MAETQFPDSRAASDGQGPDRDDFDRDGFDRDGAVRRPRRRGPVVIAVLVAALIVLYQDTWFWESDYLVLGFVPIGLFYHAMLSIAASLVWLLATWIAWPVETIEQAKRVARSREARS